MYVCVCNAVNCSRVKQAVAEGKQSVRELRLHFGFKSCCGKCTSCMRSLIDEHIQSTIEITAGEASCKATRQSFSY